MAKTLQLILLKNSIIDVYLGSKYASELSVRKQFESIVLFLNDYWNAEVYSKPNQTSKMEFFGKIVKSLQPLTVLVKASSYVFEGALNTLLKKVSLSAENRL